MVRDEGAVRVQRAFAAGVALRPDGDTDRVAEFLAVARQQALTDEEAERLARPSGSIGLPLLYGLVAIVPPQRHHV